MVVLAEEFHGLTLKRKGADEPGLFDAAGVDDDRSAGFPLSCRANKIRRLTDPDPVGGGSHHLDEPAWGVTATEQQDDVPMCDDAPALARDGGDEEESALVLYGGGGRSDAPRLAVRDGAAGWVRAMLREADSRTVRELLAGAAMEHGSDGLALALVPWVPPSSSAAAATEEEPSTAAEEAGEDDEGAAAMDVKEDETPVRDLTGQAAYGSGGAEGIVFRWPQHCLAPPQLPPAPQPSPVMWSW
ncbi:hypothetical protein HU200_065729 [Digitaria exilis]|uniref:Uncharacterized protein n=1 Tax=Digitaria exilis TaxID=1010633 RepID=A0A835A8X6_9POAL|nr:hypothetical protein HU200_065729 [Digitaria exilis]CAB3483497.1 unnamed protein product [Digitaria exilis]